jgi:hypothetical protein
LPFDDALEHQQKYITERVQHEIDCIAAAAPPAVAALPAGISIAIENMFDNHLLPAYEDENAYWVLRITNNGHGNHPYDTANALDTYYRTLLGPQRQTFLNRVRNEADQQNKIDAYMAMLDIANGNAP